VINGVLLIDKPAGPTSHDIVDAVRKWSRQRRVGHTGTLDPAATGLLVVLLGPATRLAQWMVGAVKDYEGTALFGVGTDTLDADGRETERRRCGFGPDELRAAAAAMVGDSVQVPPKYSAIKINGKPAYALARKGLEPELAGRPVTIESFQIVPTGGGDFPTAEFKLACSSGTYVRSVIADLGAALGCPAHLTSLRRTRVGPFTLERAVTVEELRQSEPEAAAPLISAREGVVMPEVLAGESDLAALRNGQAVPFSAVGAPARPGETAKIIGPDGNELLGLGKIQDGRVKPFLVLNRDLC
jgi:tRNA pseudouridine55 synthase